jgi:hypothetical protein
VVISGVDGLEEVVVDGQEVEAGEGGPGGGGASGELVGKTLERMTAGVLVGKTLARKAVGSCAAGASGKYVARVDNRVLS